jgi:hypothetical protein
MQPYAPAHLVKVVFVKLIGVFDTIAKCVFEISVKLSVLAGTRNAAPSCGSGLISAAECEMREMLTLVPPAGRSRPGDSSSRTRGKLKWLSRRAGVRHKSRREVTVEVIGMPG